MTAQCHLSRAAIFYLSGVDGRKHFIIIDALMNTKEILFLKETNDHIAVWEGEN
jgi:Xaa-Pro aminopeptidase